jgi:hypothetical protein
MTLFERLKRFPTSRNGKMAYGIFAAFVARSALNEAMVQLPHDADAAMFGFMMTAFLVGTILLALVRFDTGRPLFESAKA